MAEAPTVVVGQKVNATTKIWPASATVAYKSSDETIATVDANGEVTGVKAGKATITATMTCGTKVFDRTTEVTVANYDFQSVKQTKANTLEAVVAGATKELKVENITITNKTTSIVNPVKSVTVDATDATKVTIETFADMKDGSVYTVAIDGVEKEFTATNGVVASVTVEPVTIPYGVETEIKMVARDANAVELASYVYGDPAAATAGYTFTIETMNGYTSGSKLYLVQKGDTATASVVYHSGKYNENGVEVGNIESGNVTITAVDPEAITVSNFNIRIGAAAKSYDTIADNTKVAVGETATAYFKILNSKNQPIADADYANYVVETSNKDVMILGNSSIATKSVTVTPVAVGTAYIVVKDLQGNVLAALPVSIVAARQPASLVLSESAFTLSTSADQDPKDVKVTQKDQYGDEMAEIASGDIAVNCVSATGNGVDSKDTVNADGTGKYFAVANGKVTFKSAGVAAGTYTYTITVGKLTRTVVVTVKAPQGAESYNLDLSATSMDSVIKSANDADKKITIKAVRLEGGVLSSVVTGATITVTKNNVPVIMSGSVGFDSTTGTLQVAKVNGNVAEQMEAGTYVVTATIPTDGRAVTITRSISITNTQPTVTAERVADTGAGAATVVAGNCFKFIYDGKTYTNNGSVVGAESITVTAVETVPDVYAAGNVFFKTATVNIPLYGSVTLSVKVNVNKTVTVTAIE